MQHNFLKYDFCYILNPKHFWKNTFMLQLKFLDKQDLLDTNVLGSQIW